MSQFRAKRLDLGCFVNTWILRDHTKRKVFAQHEAERQALRYIIRNTTLPPRTRAEAQLQLTQMHCYTRPSQIRNRCMLGGKGRGVLRDFKMTRFNFRMNALSGNLPGVKKASCLSCFERKKRKTSSGFYDEHGAGAPICIDDIPEEAWYGIEDFITIKLSY
ncbi:hypothetical protein MKZ38_004756 [Zalerion maritima]|uniref:Ribosomal protein S14 n=1 Tax=Zalerion maritima TaxID=339359 RepID=A0AAD5RWF6_9PEZI|nr:hypothetical protein MKZ38_004756 [Zalerion maritima]